VLASACVFSGRPVFVPDIYRVSTYDFRHEVAADRAGASRLVSALAAPLKDRRGKSLGVYELFTDAEAGEMDRDFFNVVEAFACQVAVSLDNRNLAERNRALIAQLNEANARLSAENVELRESIAAGAKFENIVGRSPAMMQVFSLMEKVIATDATVLVQGETGTGKELVARAIHFAGPRKAKKFVTQNCAALPEALLESELFGYRKGAFTGATSDRVGLFEAASGGTIFLDEIGDMPMGLQAKLLRVLQEREVRPLGATESKPVDLRVVAATHQDLPKKIAEGTFREDLYYRLCVFPIRLPALRERPEDLPLLIEHFLDQCAAEYGKARLACSEAAVKALLEHDWPGNIRELRNVIGRAVLMSAETGRIDVGHLPADIARPGRGDGGGTAAQEAAYVAEDLREKIRRFEARVIADCLTAYDWNQTHAARALKISRRALIDKMQRYGVSQR